MTYESFMNLFKAETEAILSKQQWSINVNLSETMTKLNTFPEPLGRAIVSSFASAIAEGEVKQELFEANWKQLESFVAMYTEGKLKELLSTNVDPQIYLTSEDLTDKLKAKFDAGLQKTEALKKQEEQATDLLQGLSMLKGLEGMMGGGRAEKRKRTRTLRKKTKR